MVHVRKEDCQIAVKVKQSLQDVRHQGIDLLHAFQVEGMEGEETGGGEEGGVMEGEGEAMEGGGEVMEGGEGEEVMVAGEGGEETPQRVGER